MIRWSLIGCAVLALSACGPDYVPVTISGFAATGAAMANASVTAKCVAGPELTGTTDADGLFVLTLNSQTAPCIVRVFSGGVTLHSFANGSGRLNVTPLTELSVGKALGADPSTAFSSFDSTKASTIASNLGAAKATIKSQVETLTGKAISGDMFTSTFKVNDDDDKVLDALNAELAIAGKPLSSLVAAVSQGKPVAPRVKVFGDSLSDSGTFGLKFTVQGAAPTGAGASDIWVDLVAKPLQAARLCPYFVSTGQSFTVREECTNYAMGGGRINSFTLAGANDPRSVPVQLQAAAQVHSSYTAGDLLLIDGGGNDVADLAGAWLAAADPAKVPAYSALLASVLGADETTTFLAQGNQGQFGAGISYMTKLADNLSDAIVAQAVNKGATKVLVMNVPDVSLTPRFSAVLAGVASSGGDAGAVRTVIQAWVDAFNQRLAGRFTGSPKVAVLDYNTTFRAQVAAPASYGFTDSANTACPAVGRDSSQLPTYNFLTCTSAALSVTPGKLSPDWWQTYMFSDGFHPTPRAHAMAAEKALELIAAKRWN